MYLPSRKVQKIDELKIFRSVPHMINTDCDAMHAHRLSCYILLRRSACTRIVLSISRLVKTAGRHMAKKGLFFTLCIYIVFYQGFQSNGDITIMFMLYVARTTQLSVHQ